MTTAAAPRRLAPPQPVPPRGWGGWLLVAAAAALLAGYLLFCHGCHGDEDNELFAARTPFQIFPKKLFAPAYSMP